MQIKIVGASSPFVPAKLEAGVARLRAAGFDVDDSHALQGTHAYLNGDDATRKRLLEEALSSDVDVVWLARGGYGLGRIAGGIRLPDRMPLVVGFSDATALFARMHNEDRSTRAIHGPLATSVALEPAESVQHLVDVVAGGPGLPLPPLTVLHPGNAVDAVDVVAPIFAANLCVLAALCGTGLQPSLRGHLLVLEEIGERPYRLDRMLTQLWLSGVFDGVVGVVVGHLTGCAEPASPGSTRDEAPTPIAVFTERLAALGVPVVAGLPVGHEAPNRAIPLGARARLRIDGDTATLQLRAP
ncbi:MAG: LD-carboxypeptidase [Deltaproteobacteria bacterium]|nr:LD-carboxypeptidase [Deltaproteobacteria bacterium]